MVIQITAEPKKLKLMQHRGTILGAQTSANKRQTHLMKEFFGFRRNFLKQRTHDLVVARI